MIREDQDPLEPGQMVGDYRVSGMLAVGGMGVVYSATHPLIGKRAAIKVLHPRLCDDPEAVDRFVIEARAANQIGHPNIIDIFAFGVLSDGRSYMAMEWLQGESLAERVQRGPLTLEEALHVIEQTADALEAAHDKGIIHRDLKPDNIFLVPVRGGRTLVKLLDFGIAKLVGDHHGASVQSTRPGAIVGTPGYLAPEQARGMKVDGRTDIYALGCVAFESLTGRMPFDYDNAADMISAHLDTLPPHVRSITADVPRELDELIVRMLEKEPEKRPSLIGVRDVCREVRVKLHAPPAPPARTHRRNWLVAGAAAVVTAGLGWLLLFRGDASSLVPEVRPAPAPVTPRTPEPAPVPPPAKPAPVTENGVLSVGVDTMAQITVDGAIVAEKAMHVEMQVAPGVHEILISAPGRTPIARYLPVASGARVELPVELAPAPRPHAVPKPRPKVKKDYMIDPFAE